MRIPIEFTQRRGPLRETLCAAPGVHRRPHRDPHRVEIRDGARPPGTWEDIRSAQQLEEDVRPTEVDNREIGQAPHPPSMAEQTAAAGVSNAEEESWKHRCLRVLADFENHKRKTREERSRMADAGKDAVLEDVFPIVESLERAIDAARAGGAPRRIVEGLDLVHKELLKAIEKHGVERIEGVGEPFDPQVHEAVAVADHAGYPENTVITGMRKGFRRGDRLLRPARVVVSRSSS